VSRTRGARPATDDRSEIEGFLDGVSYRIRQLPPGERDPWVARLSVAQEALRAGDLATAEAALVAIDQALDAKVAEPELSEFPRGLVDYTPVGDRGVPTPEEEDPLANRLRLIERLVAVRRSQGRDVEALVAELTQAQQALDAGDRTTARRRIDRVHAAVGDDPAFREP
jgi:hypothetical protein